MLHILRQLILHVLDYSYSPVDQEKVAKSIFNFMISNILTVSVRNPPIQDS
jgi:hypothetical protein